MLHNHLISFRIGLATEQMIYFTVRPSENFADFSRFIENVLFCFIKKNRDTFLLSLCLWFFDQSVECCCVTECAELAVFYCLKGKWISDWMNWFLLWENLVLEVRPKNWVGSDVDNYKSFVPFVYRCLLETVTL